MEIDQAKFDHASARDKYNVIQIVEYLRSVAPFTPDIGVICGSGLSELHNILEGRVTVPYTDIPGFPLSTVVGQVGEMVFGKLGGKKVVLMRGRFHFYEGYEPAKVALPIRVFAVLGVRVVLVTNASGGVNPAYNIGDFMILQDHMSFPGLSGVSPLVTDSASHRACVVPYSLTARLWRAPACRSVRTTLALARVSPRFRPCTALFSRSLR